MNSDIHPSKNTFRWTLRRRFTPEEKEAEAKRIKLEEKAKEEALEKERQIAENRPFINYKGKLLYYTDWIDVAMICDNLLDRANKAVDITVVGFDLEWPFSYSTGSGKTAVIQISPDLTNCYILHVSKFKNLPKSLSELLAHEKIRITGNNIKNDVRKLARDFVGFDVEKMIENCIDLGVLANSIVTIKQRWSLEKLVNEFLNLRINKHKKVRMSKWNVIPLSMAQQKYAAIDAYASLLLYELLKEKQSNMPEEDDQNEINLNQ